MRDRADEVARSLFTDVDVGGCGEASDWMRVRELRFWVGKSMFDFFFLILLAFFFRGGEGRGKRLLGKYLGKYLLLGSDLQHSRYSALTRQAG